MANTFTSMIDLVYPVGSVFLGYGMSSATDTNGTVPGKNFGGDWVGLAAGKMLRSGWGSAAGGNDAHTHVTGLMWVDFWGGLTYPDNNSYNLLTNGSYPEIDSALGTVEKTTWTTAHILSRNSSDILGPWTNKGIYNEGGYYYQTGGCVTTSFGMVSKNIPYKRFDASERTYLTSNINASGLKYYGLNGSKQTSIPAYQTINTWYRKS